MVNYGDTNIIFKEIEHFFSHEEAVSAEMGFNVAFGLTSYDGSSTFEEDPDYATIELVSTSWGWTEQDTL